MRIDPHSSAQAGMAGPTSGTDALVSRLKVRSAGSVAITVTVTDSRGATTTATTRATVRCCGP